MPAVELRSAARALELAAFRTPYFGQGLDGVRAALERAQGDMREGKHRGRGVRSLKADDWRAARKLVKELGRALGPLEIMFQSSVPTALSTLAKAHVEAIQALGQAAAGDDEADSCWGGKAGDHAGKLFATLLDANVLAPEMAAADYPEFFRSLVADESIRQRRAALPRIAIWEPYESRLQQPDVAILGSLNEGIWPQAADPGPWLNRPMRATLGLPAPEERVGDAAHIFTSLLGAPSLPHARDQDRRRADGALALAAEAAGAAWRPGPRGQAGRPWLAWAQARNALADKARPVRAPEPRPPLELRPRKLSVTTIEKWIANPYAIFAQRILGLEPLPALGRQPDAALRGQIVHDALGHFAARFPQHVPDDIAAELVALAQASLAELTGSPRVAAFWAPRFARFAAWFAETETNRRKGVEKVLGEVEGKLVLAGTAGPFTLTARADRIDTSKAGIVITDYKTGGNIKELANRAMQGEAPQLPLEAAIAAAGGFTGLAASTVAELRYISGSGGEPPGQECTLRNGDVTELARAARRGLERLIATFDDAATPYRALRRARFTYRYDDYAHLARVAEWSAETDEEA